MYTFYCDHLLSVHPDEVQFELNAGLKNALYNWCVPIVTDLLEHGAIFPCENYSICIKKFIEFIYILTVCFEANNDPLNCLSMKIFIFMFSLWIFK